MAAQITSKDEPRVLPPELRPDLSQVITEDDAPVDNIFSEKQQRLLTEPLYSSWAEQNGGRRFVALANVGLFYAVHQPPYVPDMLLSLDVELPADPWPKHCRSYFVWEYGKPPDVVVEVVSNRKGGEATEKLADYARIAVTYYVIFDPEQLLSAEVMRVFRRSGATYEPLDDPVWFPEVELGLRLWHGSYENMQSTWLRWVDAAGRPIPSGRERAEQEERVSGQLRVRAAQERERAEKERRRADQQQHRADRLAEQLRALGVEPDKSDDQTVNDKQSCDPNNGLG